jgi:hypothetical protein
MYDDLIVERVPPEKRRVFCNGDRERVLPEAAVMLAFAMHLFSTQRGLRDVHIHPDGMHGKDFKIREWLERQGFTHGDGSGRTQQLPNSVQSTTFNVFLLAEIKVVIVFHGAFAALRKILDNLLIAMSEIAQASLRDE